MFIKEFLKSYIYPVVVLSGGAIGVGFLSLPYIASRVGFWVMLVYFLILSGIILTINLIFGEISLKTPDFKRFPGFVGYYLGKWGKLVALTSSTIGYFGVLLVFLIVGGEFLTSVLQPTFGLSNLFCTLLFFTLAVFVIWLDIKIIAKIELLVLSLFVLSVLFILFKGFFDIRINNIFGVGQINNLKDFFLPYGPILFALWGVGLIPEVEEMMRGNKKKMKKVIITSKLIVMTIYFLFIFIVLGITGSKTTEIAFFGLKDFLGNGILQVAILAATIVVFMAFVVAGLTFKKILLYDLKIKNWQAIVISCFTPLILFLLGLKSFIFLISFTGGVLLSIDGILILLMYRKIGGKKVIIYPLTSVFLIGIIYEIVYFIF